MLSVLNVSDKSALGVDLDTFIAKPKYAKAKSPKSKRATAMTK